jgi:hypothetical protein
MYLSIPLLGGCIVGLLVWALVLLFSSCPSQQQIDAAPSIRSYQPQPRPSSGGGGIIKRPLTDLDAENIRRIMRGEEPLPAPGSPPTQPPSPQPEVGSPETSVPAPVPREKTREYLTNLRLRAKFRAAKAGYYCGLIAGIFGYVALGYYFYQTFKNRPPEQSWRDVVQPSSEGPVDGTPYPYETAPEPAGDRPPGEQSFEPPPGDGILYEDEDFEVPPDASEPDRQEKKDSPGETA